MCFFRHKIKETLCYNIKNIPCPKEQGNAIERSTSMATAKKLPSGNWRVNLYIGKTPDGKRQYKSFTADTKKEAEFMAAQFNVDRRERQNSELTVKVAIARYIESKENVLSPMTVRGYKVVMNSYLNTLMPLKVSDVTQEAVQNEMNRMALKYSPKT